MRRMRQGRRIGCTTLVVLATTGGAGFAQETAPPISLEEMATRLAELEERNQTLQGRVNELEGAEGEAWLSEQRAQEINELQARLNESAAKSKSKACKSGGGAKKKRARERILSPEAEEIGRAHV